MRFPIVFSTDHNFVMPTCVTIHSLLSSSSSVHYDIHIIIDPDVTVEDQNILRQQVKGDSEFANLKFIEIGDTFNSGFEIRGISKACYNRLMIPWLLPEYDKVVYSDVDIIFKGDLSEVFNMDMKDYLVAGVGGEVWKKGIVKKYLYKIGANPEEYVNSGFLLINSKLQREKDLKDKYLEFSKRNYLYQDQDIINLVCKGSISKLPRTYNLKPSEIYNYPQEKVKVIHFLGMKPWRGFTYGWNEWWNSYNSSLVYDPLFAKKISNQILKWDAVIKHTLKANRQKLKFFINYLSKQRSHV